MSLLIGLDVGTSGLKAIAIDSVDGTIAASAHRDYPLHTPAPHWAEQDPRDFARAALETLADLRKILGEKAQNVSGIGLTGQMHSAVVLDTDGQPIRPAILWCDTRTSLECNEITRTVGLDRLRNTVCNLALEGFTVPKLLWLRANEPQNFARIRHVVMPKDWIGFVLTGVIETDVSDASGTLAFDPRARTWSHEMLSALSLDPSWFPTARESPTVLGGLTSDASRATGFREGLPVVRGAADNAAGAIGLGVVRSGRAMASIGTSGVVLAHTDSLRVDPAMRLHSFCAGIPHKSYLMGVMLSAGGALRWFRDTIAHQPYDHITSAASKSPRGSRGLLFLPYLMGERTPHNDASARGAFIGLTARTGMEEMSRAVLEGIAFGLCDSLDLMRAADPPVSISELRVTGGGARSEVWLQILADVFGTEVQVMHSEEGPAFGAAILAGVGSETYASVEEGSDRITHISRRIEPNSSAQKFYRESHRIYRSLYTDLRSRFAELENLDTRE